MIIHDVLHGWLWHPRVFHWMWSHWNDRKADFPEYENAVQYVNGALDFVSNPTPTMKIGLRAGTTPSGQAVTEKVFLDMTNGRFAVQILDGPEAGALKTFFPRNGGPAEWPEYWEKQSIHAVIQ